ncbi:hypothetical protein D3C75_933700 [compost metagenome]
MLIHKAFQLIDRQHPLGDIRHVCPVVFFTAIHQVHRLQIVTTVQRQNGLLAGNPAIRHDHFGCEVFVTLLPPAFIRRECGCGFGIGGSGGFHITITQGHFGT